MKADRYEDLDVVYKECSGPGGLRLAEFMADKMGIYPDALLLDVGANRGVQTCFLVKEYGVFAVGIDPWDDRQDGRPMAEHMRGNAEKWEVASRLLPMKTGVPQTYFPDNTFDFVYSTTALEMIRTLEGEEGYLEALEEIYRVLKPGAIFGLGEPMHLEVELPQDLLPYVSQPEFAWKDCFATISETAAAVKKAGFEILEADYVPQARQWWEEYAKHDPFCKLNPDQDPKTLEVDDGRWTSFGYVIGRKKP